jgi:hypothetical protein
MATKKTGSAAKGGKGLGAGKTKAQKAAAIKSLKNLSKSAKSAGTKTTNKAAKAQPFGVKSPSQVSMMRRLAGGVKPAATKGSAGSRAGGKGGGGLDAGLKAFYGI